MKRTSHNRCKLRITSDRKASPSAIAVDAVCPMCRENPMFFKNSMYLSIMIIRLFWF